MLSYEALPDPESFRILRLEPGARDAPIDCTLLTRNIHEPDLIYEAISYAWGDQSDRVSITCNGQHLSITQSLHGALAVFRLVDKPRLLWADAICINQNDLQERGSQVQLMRSIYKSASEVLIWLGPESPKT
ncbi:HET-domain-containing protein, partial [Lophiostoma macrostomum CBS 122681]